jgi:hypothetical protein
MAHPAALDRKERKGQTKASPSTSSTLWEQKIRILKHLLNAHSDRKVAEEILGDATNEQTVLRLADNLRKWKGGSTPGDDSLACLDRLSQRLGCRAEVTGAMIAEANIDEFIAYLPRVNQADARAAIGSPSESLRSADTEMQGYVVTYTPHRKPIESVAKGVLNGRLNMGHYYLEPDAAAQWERLIESEAYPMYFQCRSALQDLIASKVWQDAVTEADPLTAVALAGGGAATKDLVVLQGLLARTDATDDVYYHIVDVSYYMCLTSLRVLHESRGSAPATRQVHFLGTVADILELSDCRDRLRGKVRRPVLFTLLGGTLGNLREDRFFRSLATVSEIGDLLVVGVDTADFNETTEKTLLAEYDNPDIHRYLEGPISAVVGALDIGMKVPAVLKRLKTRVKRDAAQLYSDVSNSVSVTIELEHGGKRILILSSTRYSPPHLITFASGFHWKLLGQIASPRGPSFVQFLFRKSIPADLTRPELATVR